MAWYSDDRGETSTMRILAAMATITGLLIALSGTAAMFFRVPDFTPAIGSGCALAMGSLGAKAWQKKTEITGG